MERKQAEFEVREQESYFMMAFDFLIAPVFFTVMIRDHFRIFRSLLIEVPYNC